MSFERIPAELRDLDRWCVWRWGEVDPNTGRRRKPPYRVREPFVHASSTRPETWGAFAQAARLVEAGHADGVGFALGPPYVGVDLDGGLCEADRQRIVVLLDSYTEESVSGTGLHVVVRASLDAGRHPEGLGVFQEARFFYFSGRHVEGSPATIEEREAELVTVLAEYLPQREVSSGVRHFAEPVDVDDEELLERAFAARNGDKFQRLWGGDSTGYDSRSEADLALCCLLAFWTGRDAPRMRDLFKRSGLYLEEKGEGYLGRTIERAIAGTKDVYGVPQSWVRPAGDAPGTHPAITPAAGVESACFTVGASLRPPYKGTQDGMHPLQLPIVDLPSTVSDAAGTSGTRADAQAQGAGLVVVEAAAFAAVEEASAAPLLGDTKDTILAAGGSAVWYGDGGAGKTTLGLDQAVHLCAGDAWLGLPVLAPCTVLWIENEGPRGKFREKLREKLAAWNGSPLEGRLHVLEQPWSLFTFADERHRTELVALIYDLAIDVVFAGPVQRLGVKGGGTPAEIQLFVNLLEQVRAELERPLAYELVHHENKSGDVSGAWEGATDTLAHVQARGNGHTAIVWQKVRWASELHGRTWKLDWRAGESFELDETPETTDDAIADQLIGLVHEAPGKSWNAYDDLLTGKAKRKRIVRDQLLEDGRLTNAGTTKSMKLFLAEQIDLEEQATFEENA